MKVQVYNIKKNGYREEKRTLYPLEKEYSLGARVKFSHNGKEYTLRDLLEEIVKRKTK